MGQTLNTGANGVHSSDIQLCASYVQAWVKIAKHYLFERTARVVVMGRKREIDSAQCSNNVVAKLAWPN